MVGLRVISFIFLFLLSFLVLAYQREVQSEFLCPYPYIKVKVKRALDGDTVLLENGEKLRYPGINAPELHSSSGSPEPYAEEAFNRNRELTESKEFCLEKALKERDRYGRLLGELYFSNGTSVSEILVSEGLALVCYFEGSGQFFERLLPVQRKALEKRIGLFSFLERPSSQNLFIGNKKSRRIHHPYSEKAKRIKEKTIFKNLEEALKEGYCPSREEKDLFFK